MADYGQDSLDPGNLKKKNATEQESKKRLRPSQVRYNGQIAWE
jgi:hypothetical protein